MTINWPTDQNLNIQSTQDASAEGREFQLIFNPKHNWNFKVPASKQETIYTNINQQWASWPPANGDPFLMLPRSGAVFESSMIPVPGTHAPAASLRVTAVIPALNEQATLRQVVEGVLATGFVQEIILVDDGSCDRTPGIMQSLQEKFPESVRFLRHPRPRGKGAAVRTGQTAATGNVILVQDADLEYDPADIPRLVAPFQDPEVHVVYGSRNLRRNPRSGFFFYWGGRLLSGVATVLYGSRITDEATGYKVVRARLLRELDLRADGFDFCPELTGRLLRRHIAIHEVPISYRPRSFSEGKKIRWRDGLSAIWMLLRLRCSRRK